MSNEMRLTDVNALIVKMCRACNNECCEEPCEPGECFMYDAINNAPTVDAKPVVHGRWEWWETIGITFARCSVCGDTAEADDVEAFSFCPYCGADMRENGKY